MKFPPQRKEAEVIDDAVVVSDENSEVPTDNASPEEPEDTSDESDEINE